MPRLFFGGSFNPMHHGHLICARAVAETRHFDRVVLIPSAQPPHKPGDSSLLPAEHRLAMCRLAVQDSPLFEVDDLELRRAGPSYTLDTVRQLHQRYQEPIHWLIGADMLALLPQWHQPQTLIQEATLWIMARPEWSFDFAALPPEFHHLAANVVPAPLIDISATDIRRRVAAGLSIEYLVPTAVRDYIHQHRLYRA